MADVPTRRHHPIRQVVLIGVLCVVGGVVLILLPLLLGHWEYNKYIVVVGFLITCLGLSFLLNALVDLLRGKR